MLVIAYCYKFVPYVGSANYQCAVLCIFLKNSMWNYIMMISLQVLASISSFVIMSFSISLLLTKEFVTKKFTQEDKLEARNFVKFCIFSFSLLSLRRSCAHTVATTPKVEVFSPFIQRIRPCFLSICPLSIWVSSIPMAYCLSKE